MMSSPPSQGSEQSNLPAIESHEPGGPAVRTGHLGACCPSSSDEEGESAGNQRFHSPTTETTRLDLLRMNFASGLTIRTDDFRLRRHNDARRWAKHDPIEVHHRGFRNVEARDLPLPYIPSDHDMARVAQLSYVQDEDRPHEPLLNHEAELKHPIVAPQNQRALFSRA